MALPVTKKTANMCMKVFIQPATCNLILFAPKKYFTSYINIQSNIYALFLLIRNRFQ